MAARDPTFDGPYIRVKDFNPIFRYFVSQNKMSRYNRRTIKNDSQWQSNLRSPEYKAYKTWLKYHKPKAKAFDEATAQCAIAKDNVKTKCAEAAAKKRAYLASEKAGFRLKAKLRKTRQLDNLRRNDPNCYADMYRQFGSGYGNAERLARWHRSDPTGWEAMYEMFG